MYLGQSAATSTPPATYVNSLISVSFPSIVASVRTRFPGMLIPSCDIVHANAQKNVEARELDPPAFCAARSKSGGFHKASPYRSAVAAVMRIPNRDVKNAVTGNVTE